MLEIFTEHFGKIVSTLLVAFIVGSAGFARNVDSRLDEHDRQDVVVITKLDVLIENVKDMKEDVEDLKRGPALDSSRLDTIEKDLKDVRRYLIQVLNR